MGWYDVVCNSQRGFARLTPDSSDSDSGEMVRMCSVNLRLKLEGEDFVLFLSDDAALSTLSTCPVVVLKCAKLVACMYLHT